MRAASVLTAALLLSTLFPTSVRAAKDQTVVIRILSLDGKEQSSFKVASANQGGGVSLAVADLGTDGIPEILVGMGLGNEPRVKALRKNGTEIGSFLAYDKGFGFGVNVTACDLDGDGVREIITAPQRGGGPQVRVFTNVGKPIGTGFMAYDEGLKTGLNLACGDLDSDGKAELVTLPAVGGGPHVKAWKWNADGKGTLDLWKETFVGDKTDARGLAGSVMGGALSTVTMRGASAERRSVSFTGVGTAVSAAIPLALPGSGVTGIFVADTMTLITTTGTKTLVGTDGATVLTADVPLHSVTAAAGDVDHDGATDIVVAPARLWFGAEKPDEEKSILVDISDQRLYAYEQGILANTFLVSTGRMPYKTPIGDHKITEKVPFVHYKGGVGKDAYDLGVVQYNLRFFPHIYIHYAPWHNNFGTTMSHGCVNVNLSNMKWIYGWADRGNTVSVRE